MTSRDLPRASWRFGRCLRWRPASVGGNACGQMPDIAGQRQNIPLRWRTRLRYPCTARTSKRKKRKTAGPARRRTTTASGGEAPDDRPKQQPMTTQEWIERELAKMLPRSEAWKAETRRLWGFNSVNPDNLNKVGVEAKSLTAPVDDNRADIAS